VFDRCGLPKFCIISFVVLICRYNLVYFYFFQVYVFLLIFFRSFFVFLFSCLAEINQITFDFAEGDSELVSGFNVEFGGGVLALNFFWSSMLSFFVWDCCFVSIFLGSDLHSLLFYARVSFVFLFVCVGVF
jgi:NADH-ubiquinone oxidoreductase chain 1